MPMFYTPKPRQFHYKPRFYDPDKEDWEAIKAKYDHETTRTESSSEVHADASADVPTGAANSSNTEVDLKAELAYFESRDREMMRKEKRKASRFGWKDLIRKREMPTFNYQPRFADGETPTGKNASANAAPARESSSKRRISRRFDMEDSRYFEPISAGKIMLYVLAACLLLIWIVF